MALSPPNDDHSLSDQTTWTIKKSKISGRGLFATKLIKRGDLIFNNKPLLIGPRGDHARDSFCSICYTTENTCTPCNKCSLLLCPECKTNETHAKECDFIVENWKVKPNCYKQPVDVTRSLIYIRSLLLDEETRNLLSMFQKKDDNRVDEVEGLCRNYVIPEDQIKFMKSVDSIFKLNAFRISHNENAKRVPLRALYFLSGLMNHSCLPNTRNGFSENNNMAVYATRDINEGEEILTSYTGLLWCTPARRCQLQKTKGFWCKCERCCDRTENGTKLAALKCLDKVCNGVLLPIKPLVPNSEWQCEICATKVTTAKISAAQSVLGSLVGTFDLDNQFNLESLVLERLSLIIPNSNHIFIDLGLRLALKLGFAEGQKLKGTHDESIFNFDVTPNKMLSCLTTYCIICSTTTKNRAEGPGVIPIIYLPDLKIKLSESRLALKESLCRGTLRTVAALGVGDAHLRGLLLYHLHAALAERARRCPDQYEELKTEIECTIEQAYNILQGDISAPPDLDLRRQYLGPGCDKPHQERFFILDA